MKKIHRTIPAIIACLVTTLLFAGCKQEQKVAEAPAPKIDGDKITMAENAPQVGSVSVETAAPRSSSSLWFSGRLVWDDDSTVRVFSPVAGRVSSIAAQLGQKVATGDALAKIASPDFGQAQADARKADADLTQAERTLSRVKELFEHGAAAQKDLESAKADYDRAISEKQRTAARLTLYGGDSTTVDQMFSLKAPISGTVVEKNISSGQEVRPDQMLAGLPQFALPQFVISDPTKLWLLLDVSEGEMAKLKVGDKIVAESKAYPDKKFTGQIDVIGDALDPNTRTAKIRATVDNPQKLLKAEMYVTAELNSDPTAEDKSAVDVPAKAVFLQNNQHFVFIEIAPGQFERRSVKVGGENNGRISVEEGITAGQKVVTDGSLLLQALLDGDKS